LSLFLINQSINQSIGDSVGQAIKEKVNGAGPAITIQKSKYKSTQTVPKIHAAI